MRQTAAHFTAAQVREFDRRAIEGQGIPGFTLMQRAAVACFNALFWQWPDVKHVIVWCGTGNNGGDGLVLAGLAREAGLTVDCVVFGPALALRGTAEEALVFARSKGVAVRFEAAVPPLCDSPDTVLIDALLGTGLGGPVRSLQRAAIDAINCSGLAVLSVDIPSGLCSDTGEVLGAAVWADLTVTFIGRKWGLVRGEGPIHAGRIVHDDLGVPPAVFAPR